MEFGLMAAAGFASGWMLFWAAAAAIPILLHWLYRRRQIAVPWAAMQLLRQVLEKEAKRVRVEQLLLLLLRTLILLTLAVALARPFWEQSPNASAAVGGPPATTWILGMDISYSMGYRPAEETRWEAARQRAMEIVESAGEGDAFALVALGQPARAVLGRATLDRHSALNELRRLTLDDGGCDVRGGLRLLADLAASSKQEESLPPEVRIVLFSDWGRDHWDAVLAGSEAKALQRLAENYPLEFESFGNEQVENLAVLSLQPSTQRAIVDVPLDVDVTVANYGNAAVEQLPVALAVDTQTQVSEYVDLEPGESQTVRMPLTLKSAGRHVLTVNIPPDRLPTDNSRGYVLEARNDHHLLLVEQQTGDSRVVGLSLRPEKAWQQTRRVSAVTVVELSRMDLDDWQVVLLNDVASIDRESHSRLQRYVQRGGALVCLWGPRTHAARWNEYEAQSPLLGMRLLEPSPQGDWRIDPLEYRSPVIAPFAGFPDTGLLTTPIFRFWKIKILAEPTAFSVDLATTSGDPLIVRHPLGEGSVTSVLSAPQVRAGADGWNAMAAWPSFVPLMQQLVQTAMDSGAEIHTVLAGQPLVGKVAAGRGSERGPRGNGLGGQPTTRGLVTITQPDGSQSQILSEDNEATGGATWVFTQTHRSGLYVVRDTAGNEQPYMVNIQPSESPLRSLGREQLPPSSERPPSLAVAGQDRLPLEETSPWLSRGLLLLLGVLLLSESLLAWWMGRKAG